MGTTLTGTTPQDTYDSLIKVTDNGPISGTLKLLSDGLGNDSALALSTSVTAIRGGQQLRLFRTDNAIYGSIQYLTGAGGFKFDDANGDGYTFAQGADTRLAISATGNVGIGTSAPLAKLDVRGTTYLTSTGGDGALADAIIFGNSGFPNTQSNRIRTTTSGAASSNAISLEAGNGTTGSYVNNQLLLTGDGVVSLSQGQLKFPATQVASADANTLDDYEEGTWTMGVAFGGASVGVATTSNTGTYTKIGRQVTVNGYLVLTNKGSSAGTARITGLPFTIFNSGANYGSASLLLENVSFANQFQGFGILNSTTIALQEITVLGVVSNLTNSDFANNSGIIVSFTYFV